MAQMVKHLPTMWDTQVRSLGWGDPWRRKWKPTSVLLPGKSRGRRRLVGYHPWGRKESDMTEWLHFTLLAYEMSAIVWYFEHSLALPFFGIGIKTDLFQSCGHCWGFQICWHIECSTFTRSSFRIWNSSTGIPSPPLALFIVLLPKAHLTSHSRVSGSRWVMLDLDARVMIIWVVKIFHV